MGALVGVTTALAAMFVIAGSTTATPDAAPSAVQIPRNAQRVTVRLDPSYQGDPFQGWGTSLAWFANATGAYPPAIRNRLADLVFGPRGLDLNIARYDIGGGNAPDVVDDYLRRGAAVAGWWKAPPGTTREDTNWWKADDPDDWNALADRTQRWWVDRIKGRITRWEAFSNSPPWFQTVSGFVSGGFNARTDQLKAGSIDAYTDYLVGAVDRLEQAHHIAVSTIDPFNEPGTGFWRTRLDAAGRPVGGRQEGAHMGPQLQQKVIRSLAGALRRTGTRASVSAMDETSPRLFTSNWNSYPDAVRSQVAQLNTHTYGTAQRTTVRDIAKAEGKPLWMSEVDGSWGDRQSFTSMAPGLGMAQHMVDDLRELEPDAWMFWQPVEDFDNMKPGGESAKGANWGAIQLRFDCSARDTLRTCPIRTNTKFDTVRNFTHFLRPGDRLIKVDDASSVAALSATGATVVYVNAGSKPRAVRLDLSKFGAVRRDAKVTPIVTRFHRALVRGRSVGVRRRAAMLVVPARSVATFVITGVGGVARNAPLVRNGHVYRLQGVQSGRSLAPSAAGSGTVLRTTSRGSVAQLWRIERLAGGSSSRARYAVATGDGRRRLAVVDGAVVVAPAAAPPDPTAQWILSTTGDGTYTLVNVASKRVLDVGGGATNDGASVSVWLANSARNQRWRVTDETGR
jgi:ricin-type beta-trefoil lectin protein/glycosyl hydrolase family 30